MRGIETSIHPWEDGCLAASTLDASLKQRRTRVHLNLHNKQTRAVLLHTHQQYRTDGCLYGPPMTSAYIFGSDRL